MENNTFNIVSYLSNERGTEKTSLIYDTINKRIIEKWISYQLVKDESKFVITDRYLYVYNKFNIIYRILEIEKGEDDRMYSFLSNNNEYCHSFNRTVNKLELNDRTITEVIYTRNNYIGSKRKKWFMRSLNLLTKEVEDRIYKTRINYLLKKGRLYVYEYKQNDFCFLNKIVEYKILIDLRFINRLIKVIGLPILMSIPDLFLKVKIKEDFVHDNEEKRLKEDEQDYFRGTYYSGEKFFIQNLILIEDLFINEKYDIQKKYDSLKEFPNND
jgi:hypothetical protein